MALTTIIYITHSELDPVIAVPCIRWLLKAAAGKPIISVSQKPLDLGENICMEGIGRKGINIDKQIMAGLERAQTKYVAIAEHDCIYPEEHFNFIPPDEEHFFYNINNWLVQYRNFNHPQYNGMFSHFYNRYVQSQLICGRDALIRAEALKIKILSDPRVQEHWPVRNRIGEPGTDMVNNDWLRRSRRIWSNANLLHQWENAKKYMNENNALPFRTKIPTIDIRHGDNFTGGRRGHRRRYVLEPWGTIDQLLKEESCNHLEA